MYNFYSLWLLLNPQGEYKRRRRGCERLWAGYDEPTRQRVFETLSAAKQRGDWINPNPYFAIAKAKVPKAVRRVAGKPFLRDGPVMVRCFARRAKDMTITGPCPWKKQRSPYKKSARGEHFFGALALALALAFQFSYLALLERLFLISLCLNDYFIFQFSV